MNIFEKRERKATYTVEIPIKFTFCGNNSLSGEDLLKEAIIECYKRLESGYFDVLEDKVEVVDKKTHYTLAEKKEMDKQWEMFILGIVKQ